MKYKSDKVCVVALKVHKLSSGQRRRSYHMIMPVGSAPNFKRDPKRESCWDSVAQAEKALARHQEACRAETLQMIQMYRRELQQVPQDIEMVRLLKPNSHPSKCLRSFALCDLRAGATSCSLR